jgi:hypothetical protein
MKRFTKNLVLVCITFAFLLVACEARTSCNMLAVAGGAQHCAEMENR